MVTIILSDTVWQPTKIQSENIKSQDYDQTVPSDKSGGFPLECDINKDRWPRSSDITITGLYATTITSSLSGQITNAIDITGNILIFLMCGCLMLRLQTQAQPS